MKTCPACSAENNPDSKFCSACGGVLVPGPEATVDHNPGKNARASTSSSEADSSAHGRFLPGTKIAGGYRIVSLAGRGAMGEVYRADDLKLGHPVALKFLPPGVAESSRRFQLFLSEVRLSRQLAHPNVCRVHDISEVDGQHFLSMEYIDGEDLRALLRRIGRLPRDKGIEIAQQLCAGLAAAHEKGVLHRDLKPANVMIDGRGQARITDFGLARLDDSASGVGEIAGTPAYMAPEQLARGETTIQSDVYSLGLILYEAFTGQRRTRAARSRSCIERTRPRRRVPPPNWRPTSTRPSNARSCTASKKTPASVPLPRGPWPMRWLQGKPRRQNHGRQDCRRAIHYRKASRRWPSCRS